MLQASRARSQKSKEEREQEMADELAKEREDRLIIVSWAKERGEYPEAKLWDIFEEIGPVLAIERKDDQEDQVVRQVEMKYQIDAHLATTLPCGEVENPITVKRFPKKSGGTEAREAAQKVWEGSSATERERQQRIDAKREAQRACSMK